MQQQRAILGAPHIGGCGAPGAQGQQALVAEAVQAAEEELEPQPAAAAHHREAAAAAAARAARVDRRRAPGAQLLLHQALHHEGGPRQHTRLQYEATQATREETLNCSSATTD